MTTATDNQHRLVEFATSDHQVGVDEASMVIRGVKVLGAHSENHRRYTDSALADAAPLYESIQVCIDHPDDDLLNLPRGFTEQIGILRNCKVRPGDGVYGDLHYFGTHPYAPLLLERARKSPDKLGLSHHAYSPEHGFRFEGMLEIVEHISRVESVDLVTKPAHGGGLFEQKGRSMRRRITLREAASAATPYGAHLRKLIEMGEVAPEMMVEVPGAAEGGPAPSSADDAKSAFRQLIINAVDDESLDIKATVKRIREILKAQEKLTGTPVGGGGGDEPAEPPAEAPTMESIRRVVNEATKPLLEQVTTLKHDRDIREVLEAYNLLPADVATERLRELRECSDRLVMEETVASWPAHERMKNTAPRSTPYVPASEPGKADPAGLASRLGLKRIAN